MQADHDGSSALFNTVHAGPAPTKFMLGKRPPLPFGNCRPVPRNYGIEQTGVQIPSVESTTAHLRPVQAAKLARRAARDLAQKEGVERARRRLESEVV